VPSVLDRAFLLCIGEEDGKNNACLRCFDLVLSVERKIKSLYHRIEGLFFPAVDHLCHTVVEWSEMGDQFPRITLMPVMNIATWILPMQSHSRLFFQSSKNLLQNCPEYCWRLFFKSLKNSIDGKTLLWYSEPESQIDFHFGHRVYPLFGDCRDHLG
jgi:hypothetical protein